ncbi:MAG: selenium cofactor biosynthesis protein YqeC [Muricomes sp.]
MIKTYSEGILKTQPSFLQALGIEDAKNPVVSFVGAGGKTTLIGLAAEEYRKKGIPVIVTTTTHMKAEEKPWFLLEPSLYKLEEILKREGMVWVGYTTKEAKMKSPPPEFLNQIVGLGCPVLIEADGSKRLPLKAPAAHEPVILPQTSHVVNVYGMDSVGKTFEEICFRADIVLTLLGKEKTDIVTEKDIVKLAFDNRAGRKSVTPSMSYQIALNKVDTLEREAAALSICRLAREQGQTEGIVVAGGNKGRDENIN